MTGRPEFSHASPPNLGMRLLGWLLPEDERSETKGDLEERFQLKVRDRDAAGARIWFWFQILHLLLYFVKDRMFWSAIMFKNNFIIAWRNIKKRKAYSALNILGLAAGMTVFTLIMLFVRTELSYDRYHANARNIYRVIHKLPGIAQLGSDVYAPTPGPLAPALEKEVPEVAAATRICCGLWSDVLLTVDGKSFLEKKVRGSDPQTFRIFSLPFVRGDGASALRDPAAMLLSERAARRLFGAADPIGRTVGLRVFDVKAEFLVEGIFRDLPADTHLEMDVVIPFETMGKLSGWDLGQWGDSSCYTYLLLRPGADPKVLEAKLPALLAKHPHDGLGGFFLLQPLTGIHLARGVNWELTPGGDPRFVFLFAMIGILVLVIACVNYMNLATARSLKRAKEIGLRKVVGAGRGQIVRQFLADSLMTTALALLLAVGAVVAVLPAFRSFVEREIAFDPVRDAGLAAGLALLAGVVGVLAGSYPAFFVSAFRPVSSLKGTGASTGRGRGLRNGLIVFQFATSIALIVCTIGIQRQLRYIRTADMGYEREQIVVLTPSGALVKAVPAFKAELLRNPDVLAVSGSSWLPNNVGSSTNANWPSKPDSVHIPIYTLKADYDFIGLYGLKLAQGRGFSRDFPTDSGGAFLINEAAAKAIGWEDPLGRDFCRWGLGKKPAGKIVGVLRDFHMHSLHLPIMPLYVFLDTEVADRISIKIRGGDIPRTMAFLKATWDRFAGGYPFEYAFFDEIFDRAYRSERRLGTVFGAFAGLAVLIACLGLVGLASFTAEQKTKEIGIRKVLGASSSGVIVLLSREFMKWVVAANLIAWPIGYIAMKSWLRSFAYRTSLTVPMFLGAALAAFALAAAVISLQTYRAAAANPVESIRCE